MLEVEGQNYDYISINPVHVIAVFRTKGKQGCIAVMSDGFQTILNEDPRELSGRVSAELMSAGESQELGEDAIRVAREYQESVGVFEEMQRDKDQDREYYGVEYNDLRA